VAEASPRATLLSLLLLCYSSIAAKSLDARSQSKVNFILTEQPAEDPTLAESLSQQLQAPSPLNITEVPKPLEKIKTKTCKKQAVRATASKRLC